MKDRTEYFKNYYENNKENCCEKYKKYYNEHKDDINEKKKI